MNTIEMVSNTFKITKDNNYNKDIRGSFDEFLVELERTKKGANETIGIWIIKFLKNHISADKNNMSLAEFALFYSETLDLLLESPKEKIPEELQRLSMTNIENVMFFRTFFLRTALFLFSHPYTNAPQVLEKIVYIMDNPMFCDQSIWCPQKNKDTSTPVE